jgi:transposase-like protein
VRDAYEKPLPRYVEKAFHEYLRCGVFVHGFPRFHCDDCGGDLLVAFSCSRARSRSPPPAMASAPGCSM